MNKKYFFLSLIIIVCFILIGGILISLYLNKKNTTIATVQEKLRDIKSVYAEESLKIYDKFLKGEMREEDYTSNHSFVFPDKKQIQSYSQMMGNEESIVIGDDIYQKFPIYIRSNNKPSFVWVHAKDGEYIRYAGDETLYFTLINYPEGWDFTKKLDKIEEDLGVEEVNGVKCHHYKVKVKKLVSEDINSYFFRSILKSDATEEIIEGNSTNILEQKGDKIRYVENGKEMLIPIPNYESITIPFKVIEVKPSKVIEAKPLEVVIGAKPTKITEAEKTYDFYTINTQGIEGEIWVGEKDYFVYKEKYIVEDISFFFYPDESEQENKDFGIVSYDKYIHEVDYSNFNKDIKIDPPRENVKETKDFEVYLQSIEEQNNQQPIFTPAICVLSSPFSCEDYLITQSDGIKLSIRNRMGESIKISSIAVSNCGTNNNGAVGWTIADGSTQNIILTCTPTLTSGNKFKGDITINYKKTGGTINLVTAGILSGNVSP